MYQVIIQYKISLSHCSLNFHGNFCLCEILQCLLENSGDLPPNVHNRKVQIIIGYYCCPSPWDKRSRQITSKDIFSDL